MSEEYVSEPHWSDDFFDGEAPEGVEFRKIYDAWREASNKFRDSCKESPDSDLLAVYYGDDGSDLTHLYKKAFNDRDLGSYGPTRDTLIHKLTKRSVPWPDGEHNKLYHAYRVRYQEEHPDE